MNSAQNHLTLFLRCGRSHPGVRVSVWITCASRKFQARNLPATFDTASLRKWGMCHSAGGPLLHIREALCTKGWINSSWYWPWAHYESVLQSSSTPHSSRGDPKAALFSAACLPLLPLPSHLLSPATTPWTPKEPRMKERGKLVMWMTIVQDPHWVH